MTTFGKVFSAIIEVLNSGGFIAIIGAGAAYIGKQHLEKRGLKMKVKDLSYSTVFDLMMLNEITHIINNMFNNTTADRFVILTANNGKYHLRAANAIYEQHNTNGVSKTYLSLGITSRYIDFEFDEPYRNMLKEAEATLNPVFFKTSDMPDCDLRSIYTSEKVTESLVFFISRKTIDNDNDRLFYCSVATHNPSGFTPDHKTFIKAYVDQIKAKLKDENHTN